MFSFIIPSRSVLASVDIVIAFGFKVFVAKGTKCKKQMFSETSSAIVNAVNYLFPGGNEQYDIAVFSEDNKLEFEIVSNW